MTKDYKAYLFDWDGTLARTFEVWFAALRKGYDAYGMHPTDEEIALGFGDYSYCVKIGLPATEKDNFNKLVITTAQENGVLTPPLYEGVLEMLANLKAQHKKLALITSSGREAIDIVLAHHELIDLFDLVISADDVKVHKPDPEGILFALDHFGLPPEEAVMIGDSDKDLGAAQNAGVDGILFYPKAHEIVYDRSYLETFNPASIIADWSAVYAN